jgi:branched-chain amino acid transport system permease protein
VGGLANGAIYGLLAIGVVLVIRATGVVNFAQGEFVTLGAFAYLISISIHVNPLLQLVFVLVAGVLSGLVFFVTTEYLLKGADHLRILIATLALSIIIINVLRLTFTDVPQPTPPWLFGERGISVGGNVVSSNTFVILASGLIATAGLYAWFQFTNVGRAVRAVAENRQYAALSGINVRWMLAISWIAGAVFTGLAGLLLGPVISVFPTMGQTVLFKGFVAANLGGFDSIPGAMLGGLTLGVAESLLTAQVGGGDLKDALSFAILLLVLLIRPSGLFGGRALRRA